jgi:hypothetical protein
MRSINLPALGALALLLLALPAAAESKPSDEKKDAGIAAEQPSNEQAMFKELPVGEPFEGVRIPQMDANGNLRMLFDTQKATRIDDRHIDMEKLKIEIHNEDGTTFQVSMPHSVFDLDTNILASDTPVEIRREDFVITGDTANFHTKTKYGHIIGNVKMIIYNTEDNE